MFNVLSKFKNRIQSMSKEPEPVEIKPEAQEVIHPELPVEEKVKKVRKPQQAITNQLQIIMEVMELVRRDGHSRVKAIQIVAETRGISRSTVGDKCGRLLSLSADTFDKMLNSPDMQELRLLLTQRFPAKADIISQAIYGLIVFHKLEIEAE